jgi:hypothetical protein
MNRYAPHHDAAKRPVRAGRSAHGRALGKFNVQPTVGWPGAQAPSPEKNVARVVVVVCSAPLGAAQPVSNNAASSPKQWMSRFRMGL